MNKTDFRKSGLVSAMLVALACAIFVPAVSAEQDVSLSGSYFGECVGAGVQAIWWGDYYNCEWKVERIQGDCQSMVGNLYFTLYADGSPMSSSTPDDIYDVTDDGPYESLGASASAMFYDTRDPTYGYFTQNSGLAELT